MKKWYEETHLLAKRREETSHLSTASENNIGGEIRPSCSWCGHSGFSGAGVQGQIQGRPTTLALFCSEVCFSQCRRAAFKQTRMCDWCKHVGHSLTVTDFFEGERQLQFCGHRCVNQYKMHLFCKEASSLGIAPQTSEAKAAASLASSVPKEALITPESWLGETCSSKTSSVLADDSESLHSTDNELPSSPLDLVNYSKKTRSKRVRVKSNSASPVTKKGKADTSNATKGKATPRTATPLAGVHSAGPSQGAADPTPLDQISACGQNVFWHQGLMPFPFRPPFLDPSSFLPQWVNISSPLLSLPAQSPIRENNEALVPSVHSQASVEPGPKRQSQEERLEVRCDSQVQDTHVTKDETKTVTSSTSVFGPHYVFTPYPVLIPLPIPVPIIVPSKYLESISNSMDYKVEEPE